MENYINNVTDSVYSVFKIVLQLLQSGETGYEYTKLLFVSDNPCYYSISKHCCLQLSAEKKTLQFIPGSQSDLSSIQNDANS